MARYGGGKFAYTGVILCGG